MIGEIALYGLLLPPLLVSAAAALMASMLLRRALAILRFYRLVWHRALFDFALFIALLGVIDGLMSRWTWP